MSRATSLVFAAALIAAATLPAESAAKFHYTHRVSLSGTWVDHWTINDPRTCDAVGDGTVTVTFRSRSPAKVSVLPPSKHNLRWQFSAPYGSFHIPSGLPPKAAVATIDRVDNTTQRTSPEDDCSEIPLLKDGCGSARLGHAQVYVYGQDRKRLKASLYSDDFRDFKDPKTSCGTGNATRFDETPCRPNIFPLFGRMPSVRTFRRKHSVSITATSHESCTNQDVADGTITDDITRTITVTFTKL